MNTLTHYTLANVRRIFGAIERPGFRVWKTVDEDGMVRQAKKPITSPERLLKFIRKAKNPKALYVSISTFLNPHRTHGFFQNQSQMTEGGRVYPRAGYVLSDCIILDSHFFVDVDDPDTRVARQKARSVLARLHSRTDITLKELRFSGTKGFHLEYEREIGTSSRHPIDRLIAVMEQNESIARDLKGLLDETHLHIVQDPFRVCAAPYSIKQSGGIVRPLDVKEFMILAIEAERADEEKVAAVDTRCQPNRIGTPSRVPGRQRNGLSSCQKSFRFVDNMVNGLWNHYVTVIKVNRSRFSPGMIREVQRKHCLSDFLVYQHGDHFYCYNFKIVQYEKLIKILRDAKSENLHWFLTRGHLPLPISDVRLMGILKSDNGLRHPHSRPHCKLFSIAYEKMIGREHNSLGTMKVIA